MPKVVDHDERRREVADAILRLIAREGVAGVTVRSVAAESGWSTGVLAHYFGDKEQLLEGAARRAISAAGERLADAAEGSDTMDGLRRVLEEILPLDEQRLAFARVWTTFMAEAVTDERFGAHLIRNSGIWHEIVERLIRRGQREGSFDASLDPQAATVRLTALTEGLKLQALLLPDLDEAEQRRRLRVWLEELRPPDV